MTDRSLRFQETMEPFVNSGAIAGAVTAAADSRQVIGTAAVGWADIEARKPMQRDTLFWIASQTKPITATALMMLVEEGKVRLDDPADHYLPVLTDLWVVAEQDDTHKLLHKPERRVTVRDLLRHTSGMPFRSALEEPTLDGLSLVQGMQSYALTPLECQPGSRYIYSNMGINAAGRIIEVVSGMAYAAFLQERLFDPLGMTDTTFWPTAEQLRRLAKSYQPNSAHTQLEEKQISQLQYPLDAPTRFPMPAGGLFSTAHDVVRFCQMILNGGKQGKQTFLSPASIAEMTRRQTEDALETSYGLGWEVKSDKFGHAGAQGTQMSIYPGQDLITVFLVQHTGYLWNGDNSHDAFVTAATASSAD